MRIHKHDLDLIAEYAQGTLDDETRAASLVDSCEVCRSEFEMQRNALESLTSIGAAHMTEHEKAALHRDLWTELTTADRANVSPRSRSWSTWAAVGSAAALILFVGVLGVFGGLGGSDSAAESAEEAAAPLNRAGDDSGGADGAAAETTTTAASSTGDFGFVSSESQQKSFEGLADRIRARLAGRHLSAPDTADSAGTDRIAQNCLEEAGLVDHDVVTGFEDQTDLLIGLPANQSSTTAPISFVDPSTCEVVAVED